MIIQKKTVGGRGREHDIFAICNTPAETGEDTATELVRFDSMELAVFVLRYMNGYSLSDTDEYRAKEAIKKAAATSNHSADSHQKG